MLAGDLVAERARLTPDRTALVVVATGERLTYRDLDARVEAVARALVEISGLRAGDRIGLIAGNRPEFLDVFFAAARAGLVVVPLGTRATAHELSHIVDDSGMRVIVYDGAFADVVRALRSRPAETGPIERGIALDAPLPGDVRLVDLVAVPSAGAASFPRPHGDDLCALLYTSGTTGKPKGVMIPHRMVWWNGFGTVAGWQLREDDVSPIFTPLYHAGGLGAFLVPILTIGGTIVLHRSFDAEEVWRTIARERCTVVLGVPTIWKLLMESPGFETADLSSVRWFISGGAPLPLYIIEAYQRRGVVFKQGYGLTEVGVNCFSMTVEESTRKAGSIGKPLMFTDARLLDESGAPVPVGEVGELCLRGPHVTAGYWKNPAATAQAIDQDGYFHTGDLARRDADGFFTIAGRRKDMIISGGVNVYPAEIEGELLLHPAVADAAVVGVPHATWGEVGVAFVVFREDAGRRPDDAALSAFLEARLSKHKVPKVFVACEALPRTPYGKVVKGELRDRWLQEHQEPAR